MRQPSVALIGVAAGVLGGCGLAVLCGAASGDRPAGEGRFQLHVWTTPPFAGPSWNYEPNHGAYRVDTQTGDVWRVDSSGNAAKINFP